MLVFVLVKLGNKLPCESSTVVVPSDVGDLLGCILSKIFGFRGHVVVHSGQKWLREREKKDALIRNSRSVNFGHTASHFGLLNYSQVMSCDCSAAIAAENRSSALNAAIVAVPDVA